MNIKIAMEGLRQRRNILKKRENAIDLFIEEGILNGEKFFNINEMIKDSDGRNIKITVNDYEAYANINHFKFNYINSNGQITVRKNAKKIEIKK